MASGRPSSDGTLGPDLTPLYRENWLREYLQSEEVHRNQPSEELKADPDEVSAWADLMRNSKVGDVLVATGWLLDYPLSGIEVGARLIVVNNQLQQADPSLWARVAPVDKNFMILPKRTARVARPGAADPS